jgi:hydrogenase maturation protease
MTDLRSDLRARLTGRVCLDGIGNPDLGDDAFGPRLAEALQTAGVPDVVVAGPTPEHWIGRLAGGGFDTVVFLDAVEVGAEPGAVALLDAGELAARFPQISTHKFSLGTLARLLETMGRVRTWLLGVQPKSLAPRSELTPPLQASLAILKDLLCDALSARMARATSVWGQP